MRNACIAILCVGSIWILSPRFLLAQAAVSGRAFQIVTSNLPLPEPGVEYKAELKVVGGKAPYSWAILQQGLLPPGLAFDSIRGIIFGIPQSDAQFSVLVQVSDS